MVNYVQNNISFFKEVGDPSGKKFLNFIQSDYSIKLLRKIADTYVTVSSNTLKIENDQLNKLKEITKRLIQDNNNKRAYEVLAKYTIKLYNSDTNILSHYNVKSWEFTGDESKLTELLNQNDRLTYVNLNPVKINVRLEPKG